MTYKLDPEVRGIASSIVLSFSDGREDERIKDGVTLADAVFSKRESSPFDIHSTNEE